MNGRSARVALGLLSVVTILWSSVVLGQGTPPSAADAARVTMWSIKGGRNTIYFDRTAMAVLPNTRSFATLETAPGWHLLWGSADPEWFRFDAGHTYALVLTQFDQRSWQWCLDDTLHGALYFEANRLTEVTSDPTALSKLTEKVTSEKFEKMRKRAGEPVEPRLPADFEALYRKSASPLSHLFKVEMPKAIHVDTDSITVKGGVTIPTAEIHGLQCFGGDAGVPWMALLFRDPKNPDLALFGVSEGYNRLYSAIALARATARARTDTTDVTH